MKAKRAYLTPREMEAMLKRQNGVCFAPKCDSTGPFIAEHWFPVALGNDKKPDCLLCEPCADSKTYGSAGRVGGDIRDIYHIRRIAEGRTQYDKRQKNGSKLRSGGFKGWRKMNGEVVRNDR